MSRIEELKQKSKENFKTTRNSMVNDEKDYGDDRFENCPWMKAIEVEQSSVSYRTPLKTKAVQKVRHSSRNISIPLIKTGCITQRGCHRYLVLVAPPMKSLANSIEAIRSWQRRSASGVIGFAISL